MSVDDGDWEILVPSDDEIEPTPPNSPSTPIKETTNQHTNAPIYKGPESPHDDIRTPFAEVDENTKILSIKEPAPRHMILPININIMSTKLIPLHRPGILPCSFYTTYVSNITTSGGTWSVNRRYNSFLNFYKSLCKVTNQTSIAGFPRNYPHTIHDHEFIENRRIQLNNFMKDAALLSTNPEVCRLIFMFFLPIS